MDAKPLLSSHLSEEDYELFGKAITTAYKACDQLMCANPVLNNFLVGMDQRSRLISVFVEHALTKMEGFFYELQPNAARNCWHTRVHKGRLVCTAHFLGRGKARKLPNTAINRMLLGERNYDLFQDESDQPDIGIDQGYCWILHAGFIKPNLASLAVPNRSQDNIFASTTLPLPKAQSSDVEQVREEMVIRLLKSTEDNEKSLG